MLEPKVTEKPDSSGLIAGKLAFVITFVILSISPLAAQTARFEFPTATYELSIMPEVTTGYDRDEWNHWIRVPGTRQNIRDAALIEESLVPVTTNEGASGWRARVLTGRWICPYTGLEYTESSDVDVDHVVALAEAYHSGGWAWTDETREQYANYLDDPDHLVVVDDATNSRKGALDPAEFLEEIVESYRCNYLEDWVRIKHRWVLSVDQAEAVAINAGIRAYCQ